MNRDSSKCLSSEMFYPSLPPCLSSVLRWSHFFLPPCPASVLRYSHSSLPLCQARPFSFFFYSHQILLAFFFSCKQGIKLQGIRHCRQMSPYSYSSSLLWLAFLRSTTVSRTAPASSELLAWGLLWLVSGSEISPTALLLRSFAVDCVLHVVAGGYSTRFKGYTAVSPQVPPSNIHICW